MSKSKPTGAGFDPTRRRVLGGMAAVGAAGLAAGCGSDNTAPATSSGASGSLPAPQDSGIDHIVVVMMENRAFDHILGWLPGANGMQAGLSFNDVNGAAQSTFAMASSAYGFQGCGFSDPNHAYDAGRTEINGGAMDGFLQPQSAGDVFPIGYYVRDDLPFYGACADNWTICDAYHSGILGPTFPNRIYMHTGQTDRISNTYTTSALPTVWDSLLAANVSCRYYYADTPYLSLWGSKYTKTFPISYKLQQFVDDFSEGGTAPSVSYVDPYGGGMIGIGELFGTSWDDHAYADVRNGQCFLNYIYNIISNSPVWDKTLLIINYDEWGGFFDHVAPPTAPITAADQAAGNDGLLGIRVPCILIGPHVKRGFVETAQHDPNSILNMIAWRFGFDTLGARGTYSGNMATVLDFSNAPNTSAPVFDVSFSGQTGPFPTSAPWTPPKIDGSGSLGSICSPFTPRSAEAERQRKQHYAELNTLRAMGRQYGFGD